MDIAGIFSVILESLRSVAILFVIFGMASAFLWKIAFYVQLVLGLIVTSVVTYLVYSFTQMFGLPVTWALLVLFIGVVASILQAVYAAVMAILNGFLLSWLGIFLFLTAGQGLDIIGVFTRLGSILATSAVVAVILIGIAAYAGGHLFAVFRLPKRGGFKPSGLPREVTARKYPSNPERSFTENKRLSMKEIAETGTKARISPLESPSSGNCGICKDEWFIDSETFRCSECGTNFHLDCINEYLNRSHLCPGCHTPATLSLD